MSKRPSALDRAIKRIDDKIAVLTLARELLLEQPPIVAAKKSKPVPARKVGDAAS